MGQQPQPYQSVWGTTVPVNQVSPGGQFLTRQTFYTSVDATLYAVRFYRDRFDGGNHIAVLIKRATTGNRDGQRATAFVRNPAGIGVTGWNNKYLGQPLDLIAGDWWDLIVWHTAGVYWQNTGGLVGGDVVSGILTVPQDGRVDPFGVTVNNGAWNNGAVNFNPNVSLGGPLLALDVLVLPKP